MNEIIKNKKILPLYYDFNWNRDNLLEDFVAELVRQCAGYVAELALTPDRTSGKVSLSGLSQHLVELSKGGNTPVPLLLLDNINLPIEERTHEARKKIWLQIEAQLIEPLITRRGMVVSTGSSSSLPWQRYEIQRRVNPERERFLLPFNVEQACAQIQQAGYQLSERCCAQIQQLSAGIPGLIDRIARVYSGEPVDQQEAEISLKPRGWCEQMQQIYTRFMVDVLPDADVRQDLDILFPLRSLRVETLRYLLTSRKPALKSQSDFYFREALHKLTAQSETIWYVPDLRACVIAPVVRKMIDWGVLVRSRLEQNQSYWELHQNAAGMYWDWAKDTPKVSEEYLLEILFHRAKQFLFTGDQKKLSSALSEVTAFAGRNLHVRRKLDLREAFRVDDELHDLLPLELWERTLLELKPAED